MYCWSCGVLLSEPHLKKPSFRTACISCGAALHCCQGCKYYKIGRPNDCMIPDTEYVSDRSAANFCEEFSLLGKPPEPKNNRLKQNFNDLFKD